MVAATFFGDHGGDGQNSHSFSDSVDLVGCMRTNDYQSMHVCSITCHPVEGVRLKLVVYAMVNGTPLTCDASER